MSIYKSPPNPNNTYCARCRKGYDGNFDKLNTTKFSDKIFSAFNKGFIDCSKPIFGCEYFRLPHGMNYRPTHIESLHFIDNNK